MCTDDVFKIIDSEVSVAENIKFSKNPLSTVGLPINGLQSETSSHRYFTLALSDVPSVFW